MNLHWHNCNFRREKGFKELGPQIGWIVKTFNVQQEKNLKWDIDAAQKCPNIKKLVGDLLIAIFKWKEKDGIIVDENDWTYLVFAFPSTGSQLLPAD